MCSRARANTPARMHTRNVRSRTLRLLEDLVSKGEVRAEQALNRLGGGGVFGEDTELREFGCGREWTRRYAVSHSLRTARRSRWAM
jgi:hypothetical protein